MSMLTYSLDAVAEYIFSKLTADKATLGTTLQGQIFDVQDVWYSDQETIPRLPAICVEPGNLARADAGPNLMTVNNFEVFIIVYAETPVIGGTSTPKAEMGRRVADQILENVAKDLHGDIQLGGPATGLVTYGYFTTSQSGYAVRGGKLLRASRGLWRGKNKTRLV